VLDLSKAVNRIQTLYQKEIESSQLDLSQNLQLSEEEEEETVEGSDTTDTLSQSKKIEELERKVKGNIVF
jgi:hypothetical protein